MILSTLDTKSLKKQGIIYLIISMLCAIFGVIYEFFSHDVYSNYMIFAFLIPLILGSTVSFGLCIINKNNEQSNPGRLENKLYGAGIATLTVGSIFNGVLEIYGTTNVKIYTYLTIRNSLYTNKFDTLCNTNYKNLKITEIKL